MNPNKYKRNKSKFYIKKNEQRSLPKKIIQNNMLIKRILAYSAEKINANPPAPYSTLKPDTSSDSPSAKSKGVRFSFS